MIFIIIIIIICAITLYELAWEKNEGSNNHSGSKSNQRCLLKCEYREESCRRLNYIHTIGTSNMIVIFHQTIMNIWLQIIRIY